MARVHAVRVVGAVAVLVIAGIVLTTTVAGPVGTAVGLTLIGAGAVVAVAAVFFEVGRSEDRARAEESERRAADDRERAEESRQPDHEPPRKARPIRRRPRRPGG